MALYESIFIFYPKTEEEEQDKILNDFRSIFEKSKCNIRLDLKWGKRPLAYLVKKEKDGIFHYFAWENGEGNVADLLQKKVRITEQLIRSFHVRVDEELKPLLKRYKAGKETSITGVIRGDGGEKETVDLLDMIYHEPTAVYLREEY